MSRAGAVALVVALACGAWLLQQRAHDARRRTEAGWPRVEGRIEATGLEAPIEIVRDPRGVPHVTASSERDAYFGLGFVHAQDRLGQMLSLWLSARGRTAEIVGEDGLPADRMARVLGIGPLADRAVGELDPATRGLLAAYAAGVSARLSRLHAGLAAPPAQFVREALPLASWAPADSIAILKVWAWGLGGSLETSLVLDDLLRFLGPARARPFFPAGAGVAPLPGQGKPSMADAHGPGFRDPLRRALRLQAASVGSSAWVLAGARSASGKPLLAADAHLEATVPAHFYQAHLRGGGLDVAGATLPGIPVFWTGANRRVAWGATAARASVMDLFVESIEPGKEEDPGRYHDGDRWRVIGAREETVAVHGDLPVTLTVLETGHGPLVNALLPRPREPLALAWAGAWPGDGIGPWLRAARAADGEGFVAALAAHHEPALAVAWVDADGRAGTQVAGWIPNRALPSGLVPVSGRSAWAAWQERVPADRLPAARIGPKQPFLVLADGPLEPLARRRIEWLWRTGERSGRIEALLEEAVAEGPVTLPRMAEMQLDVASSGSRELLRGVLALAGSPAQLGPEEREVLALLEGWDGVAARESVGAAAYQVFLGRLTRALLEPVLGPELLERYVALVHANPRPLVSQLLAGAEAGWQSTPEWTRTRVRETLHRILRETWLHFGVNRGPNRDKWSWGRLHTLQFRPFGILHWARLPESELGPHAYPGDLWSVAAGGYDPLDPFAVRTASTHRLAADAAELDKLLVSLAPGQTEQLGHGHRVDGVADWLAGRSALLSTSAVMIEQQADKRLRIVPVGWR